jgi:hypothetical protein
VSGGDGGQGDEEDLGVGKRLDEMSGRLKWMTILRMAPIQVICNRGN